MFCLWTNTFFIYKFHFARKIKNHNNSFYLYSDDGQFYVAFSLKCSRVDDRQMGHINQVWHLSKTPLILLKIHEISTVVTFESKQQNYDQI